MHVVRFTAISVSRRYWLCKYARYNITTIFVRSQLQRQQFIDSSLKKPPRCLIGFSFLSIFSMQSKIWQLKSILAIRQASAETRRARRRQKAVHDKIDFEPYSWNEPSFIAEVIHKAYVLWRCFLLMFMYGPVLVTYPLIRWNHTLRRKWWRALYELVQRSGPIFIKFGQWISTRRDLFPAELCDMFAQLQRRAPPHAWSYTEQVLISIFGENWESYFSEFDRNPCGSGCIAQVHKARLAYPEAINSPHFSIPEHKKEAYVAVKVMHPSVGKLLKTDLSVLRFFISVASTLSISKAVDLRVCLEQFSEVLWRQIDLRFEGRALKIFRRNFEGQAHIHFPEPFHESTFVLVETFEAGLQINEYITHPDQNLKSKLANWGASALFKMIFKDNFVHGDLHAGNILVQEYDSFSRKGAIIKFFLNLFSKIFVSITRQDYRLVLLDTGLVVEMKQAALDLFRETFIAIIRDKGRTVADLMLENAPVQTCPDLEAFRQDIEMLVHKVRIKPLALGEIDVSRLLTELFGIVEKHEVKLETTFTNVVLAVIILEGLGRELDPALNLFNNAKEYLV